MVIGNDELQKFIGRQTAGYTRGLPKGVSLADEMGNVAIILTASAPSTSVAPTGGLLYWDGGNNLKLWTGSAWKTIAAS